MLKIDALIEGVDPVLASTSQKEWSLHVLVCHFQKMVWQTLYSNRVKGPVERLTFSSYYTLVSALFARLLGLADTFFTVLAFPFAVLTYLVLMLIGITIWVNHFIFVCLDLIEED